MPLGAPTASIARSGISIELNQADMLRVNVMLAGVKNGAATVIMRAVNKTLAGVRTDTVAEIRKGVNVTAKAVRDTITLHKAGKADLRARVESRQDYGTSLAAFGARQTTKGVTVQVLRRSGRKLVRHAFINRKPGGNVVFWRKGKERVGTAPFRRGFPYGRLPRPYRLPIEKLWGPAVPALMKHRPTFDAIEASAKVRLDKNFAHELEYLLSRL